MLKYEVWCDNCNELVGRITVEAFQVNKLNKKIKEFQDNGCFNCKDLKIHVKRLLLPLQYTFKF